MNIIINNKIIIFGVLFCLIFTFFSCKKEEKQKSILSAQTVFGDVTIESEGNIITPVTGTEIKENSIIRTGKLSIIDLLYKDSGVIRINENSSLNVARLISSEQADETILQMDKGKVFVSVAKLLKKSKFQVQTATTVAAIRGTSFRVSAESGKSRIDVLAGKVRVNPVKNNKVIETVEQIVETNNAVEIEETAIDEIIEEKKEIKIVKLQREEIETIKEEVKLIKMEETMAEETKNEIKEIGIEVKPADEIKNENLYKEQLTIQLQKVERERKEREEREAKEAELREELKLQKEAENRRQRQEQLRREELRKEKLRKEQLKLEQMKREKAEKEREAKEQQLKEEKKKEENRVKNIPNF